MSNEHKPSAILSPETLAAKILQWKQQRFHVLSPAIQMSHFAPGYGVNASLVMLDPVVDDKGRGLDVYYDKATMGDNDRGLSKIGLGRIASAVGVSWVSAQSGRRDPLTIQNFWIYQTVGVYLAYDGTPQTILGEKEIDYRDGSAQIGEWSREAQAAMEARNRALPHGAKSEYAVNGWSAKRVMQARCNGAERAETGAMERAIRMGFGIKHVYTVDELSRPFVALRVCPVVDMSDPEVARMVSERQLSGVAALYSGAMASSQASRAPAMHEARGLPEARPAERIIDVPQRQTEPVQVRRQEPAAAEKPQAAEKQPDAPKTAVQQHEARLPERDENGQIIADDESDGDDMPDDIPTGAVMLASCQKQQLNRKANHPTKPGQPYDKWTCEVEEVDTRTGETTLRRLETIFYKHGEIAERCYAAGRPVYVQYGPESRFGSCDIMNIADSDELDEAPAWADPSLRGQAAPQQARPQQQKPAQAAPKL